MQSSFRLPIKSPSDINLRRESPSLTELRKTSIPSQLHLHEREQRKNEGLSLKKTVIEFGRRQSKNKKQNFIWTSQNWLPCTSSTKAIALRRRSIPSHHHQYEMFPEKKEPLSSKIVPKIEQRDTQTILRKNSLFLLSFIQTRSKRPDRNPHIGDFPAIT